MYIKLIGGINTMKFTQLDLDELNETILKDYPIKAQMFKYSASDMHTSMAELVLKNIRGLRAYTFSPIDELNSLIGEYFYNKGIVIRWNNTHTIFWTFDLEED